MLVLCCSCAGCVLEVWSCSRARRGDGAAWYEPESIGTLVDPWARHPYALLLYAIVVVILMCAHVVQGVMAIAWWLIVGFLLCGSAAYHLSTSHW